jgi:hypothetical protein
LQDGQGIVTHYVGIQTDVSKAAGMLHTPEALKEQQAAGKSEEQSTHQQPGMQQARSSAASMQQGTPSN